LTFGAKFSTIAKVKQVIWDQSARETVRSFSLEVRQEIGALLRILQDGGQLGMPQSRPMKQVGPSVFELRVKDRDGIYRVFYMLFDKDRILIPHVFTKKTQKTPRHEIETAHKRLRRLINENE
jgi:phage-related protein